MSETPQPASTVIVLRPAGEQFEVFLLKRHRRSGFMPSAWVFPGGRCEPADAGRVRLGEAGLDSIASAFDVSETLASSFGVAAVRETYEESGIWLGRGALLPDARPALIADGNAIDHWVAKSGAALSLDRLYPWARWVTPTAERRRYDTAFFVAVVEGDDGVHCDRETVDSGWFRPAELVDGDLAERFVAPPTWWTLRELAELGTLDAVVAATSSRDLRPIEPTLHRGESGVWLVLPGHAEHAEGARPGFPSCIQMTSDGWEAVGI